LFDINIWYNVVVKYTGSGLWTGVSVRIDKTNITVANNGNTLGGRTIISEQPLRLMSKESAYKLLGCLDNVKIAYSVLSDEQVDQEYNNIQTEDFWGYSNLSVTDSVIKKVGGEMSGEFGEEPGNNHLL
jgi:hypothetical protein